jgi:hypothetical protein
MVSSITFCSALNEKNNATLYELIKFLSSLTRKEGKIESQKDNFPMYTQTKSPKDDSCYLNGLSDFTINSL